MAEKSDEEIIKEVGLENSNTSDLEESTETLPLNENEILEPIEEIDSDEQKNNNEKVLENEDKDDINKIKIDANEDSSTSIQKKQPKIYKTLIGIVILLFLVLATGLILYFTGFFDPEPIKTPAEKVVKKEVAPKVIFNSKDLDKTRLNKKLTMLTKREIMNKEEFENEEKRIKAEEKKQKEAEEKALLEKKQKEEALLAAEFEKIENEKKLLQEHQKTIKDEQEKFLKIQEQAKLELEQTKTKLLEELEEKKVKQVAEIKSVINEPDELNGPSEPIQLNETTDDESEILLTVDEEMNEENLVIKEESDSFSFLSFINVATIKGNLYKSYLDDVQKYDKKISLCRDYKNRIEIYFGPYSSDKEREKVFNNLLENGFKEAYLIDFTNEEYQKRCKY